MEHIDLKTLLKGQFLITKAGAVLVYWTILQILSNAETEYYSIGYKSGTALYDCNFHMNKDKTVNL